MFAVCSESLSKQTDVMTLRRRYEFRLVYLTCTNRHERKSMISIRTVAPIHASNPTNCCGCHTLCVIFGHQQILSSLKACLKERWNGYQTHTRYTHLSQIIKWDSAFTRPNKRILIIMTIRKLLTNLQTRILLMKIPAVHLIFPTCH
jgi:hypothetical protein